MGNSEFVIEKKFDGERVQVHRRGDSFRMFSRNSNEVTRTYGHLLIPILQRGIVPTTVILDGELIVYDTVTNRFEDFGKLKTLAVGTRPDAPAEAAAAVAGKQLCYVAFDILYVNERSCMDEPLVKRHELLSRCIKVTEHELEVVEWQRAVSTQQLVDALDQAIVQREEGLMVKNLNSPYVPDLRQDAWLKIKPEYLQGVGDHMDLLIVGGYFGVGRRANNVSHFMVGVRGPEHTSERPQFYSFAKVGSGYSDTELRQLQDRLQAHWCIYNTSRPPPHLVLADPFRERPDVYLDPRNSVVLEVKAAQVVTTEKFRTGYTMRFPRVERIRFDKGWEDGMDMAQLREVALEFEGRFGRRRYDGGGSSMPKKRARRKLPRSRVVARTVLQQYQPADVSGVHVVEDLFGGAEYCVMNGDTDHPKDALERLLVQYGAEVVQYPTSGTHLVVAARKTLRCMNLIRIGSFDVVNPLYVVESVAARRLQELLPKYLLFATIATQQRLQDKVDSYGDPYEFDATIKSLQDSFVEVDKLKPASEQWANASAEEIDEFLCAFDARLFATPPEWALFRGAIVYLDRYRELGKVESLLEASALDAVGYLLRYHGARISTEIAADITHVLLDPGCLERLADIRFEVRRLLYQPPHTKVRHVLFKAWVFDSVRRNEVLDERDYYP